MVILFIIVLYKCQYHDCKSYRTLISKSDKNHVFIYDNSPDPQSVTDLNVTYIHDPTNRGISHAYNVAADYARRQNYDWLLLMDQDTTFSEGIMDDYLGHIFSHPEVRLFVPPVRVDSLFYMSPVKLFWKFGFLSKCIPSGQVISLYDYSPINSGMCISVDAFFECGGYNENVFLDYSDYQFIERFRKRYSNCYVLETCVYQDFSVVVDNRDKSMKRLVMFCKSLKHFERNSILDSLGIDLVVIKRSLSLMVKYKSLRPLDIFFKFYIN